jgi:hypothetical protein
MVEGDTCSLGRLSAITEARALLPLLENGSAVEELRQLVAVDSKTEQWLLAFARAHPEEAHFVDRALMFRQAVLDEFNRLVSDGVPVNQSPEAEETESESVSESKEMVLPA